MLALLLGAVVGCVLALTGAGGGILAVPMLVLILHVPVTQAAATALLVVGGVAAVGALLGLRQGIVRYRAALLMGGAGVLTAPLGSYVAGMLPSSGLLAGFAVLMALLAWRQWHDTGALPPRQPPPCVIQSPGGRLGWTSACARAIAATGMLSGFFSGLAGVGGGFVIVPSLARFSDMPWSNIQATTLAVIALVSAGSSTLALWQGRIDWWLTLPFASGALLCYLLLRGVAQHLPPRLLRRLFAVLAALVATLLLLRAGHWL